MFDLISEGKHIITVLAMIIPRFLTVMALIPIFSKNFLPGMLRNGMAISLTIILVPPVMLKVKMTELAMPNLTLIILKEVMVGFLLSLPLVITFWAAEAIGAYIDNQRGASMASSMDPLTNEQTTPLGQLFIRAHTTFFLASGSFLVLLDLIYTSYITWPVTEFFPTFSPNVVNIYLGLLDRFMWLVIVLSAPVIISMMLAELALALISRFAPQLNVFFLAMPVKSAMGIFILIIYLPLLVSNLMGQLDGYHDLMEQMGRAFR
ncbi:MAG: type III secretion system export apparatus subunit SctT [Methylocystaceae bacterium]|nr:type III secretion system export apparatus subunit SctT [Methylocystaceae bacterium]